MVCPELKRSLNLKSFQGHHRQRCSEKPGGGLWDPYRSMQCSKGAQPHPWTLRAGPQVALPSAVNDPWAGPLRSSGQVETRAREWERPPDGALMASEGVRRAFVGRLE